jgi:acyl-coenzyme A synthetase/AMP-(fatty) acid ligase
LNYRYTAPGIDHALEVSEAVALVAHAERAGDVASSRLASSLPLGLVGVGGDLGGTTFEALCATQPVDSLPSPVRTAPAAIFFTSGSTGPAKGVTHSRESLGWMATTAARAFELTVDDVFLPASSMSHLGSFLWVLTSFGVGARVVVARTFDAGEVLPLLRAHRPTVMAMIPAALTALIRDHDATPEDFASLRICRAGADAVSSELYEEFCHLVGFLIDEGYGMTEVGLATLNPPSGEIRRGSIGPPVPGVDVRLVDDDGSDVDTGEVGRILIRTKSRMTGYWSDSDATAEVIRDGWVDSGDLARADPDGYLWFFGRKKQIIVHDGSNISPYEVESALAEHPAVDLVGVVGIHDTVHGENVRAYVTLVDGAPRTTAHDLVQFARARVGYRAPEEVVFLDEMPLNPTGKIDRVGLKRFAEQQLHPHHEGDLPA